MINSALRTPGALLDWVFGFDFFISYAHSDGGRYPAALRGRLQHGFAVFLDKTIYVAGDELNSATSRRVRMSRQLVLVMRRRTHLSLWVQREVEAFTSTGRPLIVININGAWEALPVNWPLRATLEHRLRISEDIADDDGEPSDVAVGELIRSFKTVRRETLRSRVLAVTAAAFLTIALIAFWQRSAAIERLHDAQAMTIRLLTSAGEFERARSIAFASSSDDARFALARIVLPQLSPFGAAVSTSAFDGGVLGLAFQRRSGILMALDRSSVIQIDPGTGNLLRRRKYDKGQRPGSTISALGEPGNFLITDGEEALICNVSTGGIACTTPARPVGLRDLQWLTDTNYGVALCAGQTATIFLLDDALTCGPVLRAMRWPLEGRQALPPSASLKKAIRRNWWVWCLLGYLRRLSNGSQLRSHPPWMSLSPY